jgi:shikimate dehydrogenase
MSIGPIRRLTKNQVDYPDGKKYAAIIGEAPSKGARSPVLWDAAFDAHKVEARMLPLDVDLQNLNALLSALEIDCNFIGGAIAAPYKTRVAVWLNGNLTSEAKTIGSVNCIFRDENHRLAGTNTDGEAALQTYEGTFGSVEGQTILVLGCGGAGRAVSSYFNKAVGNKGKLFVSNRSERTRAIVQTMGANWIDWNAIEKVLPTINGLINCTILGSEACINETPLTKKQLNRLSPKTLVFDIIYQPSPTNLLRALAEKGCRTLDGKEMNLIQAVLAYKYVNPTTHNLHVTRNAMELIKQKLFG